MVSLFTIVSPPPNTVPDSTCSVHICSVDELKLTDYCEFLSTLKVCDKCSVLIIPKDCMSSDLLLPDLGHYYIGNIVDEKGVL